MKRRDFIKTLACAIPVIAAVKAVIPEPKPKIDDFEERIRKVGQAYDDIGHYYAPISWKTRAELIESGEPWRIWEGF